MLLNVEIWKEWKENGEQQQKRNELEAGDRKVRRRKQREKKDSNRGQPTELDH